MKQYFIYLFIIVIGNGVLNTLMYAESQDIKLEKMVGQMVMVGVSDNNPNNPRVRTLLTHIESGRVGGVILLKAAIKTPRQVKILVSSLRHVKGPFPLLIGIDQEGGAVQRLSPEKGFQHFSSAQNVGYSFSNSEAFAMYDSMAMNLMQLGINLNFGPVVDINVNPSSPVIGRVGRSFSRDAHNVYMFAKQFVDAHHGQNILTVLKHYPGHGSSQTDSHKGIVDITNRWTERELYPYLKFSQDDNIDIVMVSHTTNYHIDDKPASLSYSHIQHHLRPILFQDDIVMTDDLLMEGISHYFSLKESIIHAVNAGNDILLFADSHYQGKDIVAEVSSIIISAVKSGQISERTIITSYKRITALKKYL
ncbi:MAG: glycoside hydrolase family 3 protein [Candidatus Margulisbacteria bacterium]|nr:glycoside hydrolase family 3 protein [Candidatus Margulisiibacteriota bacterium]